MNSLKTQDTLDGSIVTFNSSGENERLIQQKRDHLGKLCFPKWLFMNELSRGWEKLQKEMTLPKEYPNCHDYSAFHVFIGSQANTPKQKSTAMESKILELLEDRIQFFTRMRTRYNQKIENTLNLSNLIPTKKAYKSDRAA